MCLPDTKITTLNLSQNFICCNYFYLALVLKHTQITSLNISTDHFSQYHPPSFLQKLKENNTFLDLSNRKLCALRLCYLARLLENTQIISLNLRNNPIESEGLKYISQGLLKSQVVELDLSCSNIDCVGAYYLAQVIRHTRISSLNLSGNLIACEGLKYLAQGFEGSQIASLDLSGNCIKDEGALYLTKSLADTQIIKLLLGANMLGIEAAYQMCKSVCQTKVDLMHVGSYHGDGVVPYCLSLYRYPGCFIEINQIIPTKEGDLNLLIGKTYQERGITKLIFTDDYSVNLGLFFHNINITEVEFKLKKNDQNQHVASIFEKSNIVALKMNLNDKNHLWKSLLKIKVIALHLQIDFHVLSSSNLKLLLMQNNIVYLDLSKNILRNNFEKLVELLKGSKIISLNLSSNCLEARNVDLLARVLPDTKLTYIDLHGNKIGYPGFKHLLDIVDKTSICWLSLGNNNIEEGLQNDIELSPYIVPRNDTPIEIQIRYLFRELVSLNTTSGQFEFIIPREDSVMTINHYPRFVKHFLDTPIYKMHVYDYFYMQSKRHDIHVLNRINVFIRELKQHFFSFFEMKMKQISEKFGYDSFVNLVKECDSLNLTDFVEYLLLHRVLYYVDDEHNFLHPFIYKMLYKYKMPLYNEDIEPNKKQQIISYFEEHSDIDGAGEIIDLLK